MVDNYIESLNRKEDIIGFSLLGAYEKFIKDNGDIISVEGFKKLIINAFNVKVQTIQIKLELGDNMYTTTTDYFTERDDVNVIK